MMGLLWFWWEFLRRKNALVPLPDKVMLFQISHSVHLCESKKYDRQRSQNQSKHENQESTAFEHLHARLHQSIFFATCLTTQHTLQEGLQGATKTLSLLKTKNRNKLDYFSQQLLQLVLQQFLKLH